MCNFSGILYISIIKRKTKIFFHGAPEMGFVDVKTKDFIFVLYFLLPLGTMRIFLQPNTAHPHLDFILNLTSPTSSSSQTQASYQNWSSTLSKRRCVSISNLSLQRHRCSPRLLHPNHTLQRPLPFRGTAH